MEQASTLPLWLTEDITWVVLWVGLVVAIAVFAWFVTQKMAPLLVAGLGILAIVGAVVVEMQVETDREYLVKAVYAMADAVRKNDAEGVAAFVSDELPELQATIEREKKRFNVTQCNVIGFRNTDLLPNDRAATEADVGFSVFGSGAYTSSQLDYSGPVAVDLKFKKLNGEWSIVEFSFYPANAPKRVRTYK